MGKESIPRVTGRVFFRPMPTIRHWTVQPCGRCLAKPYQPHSDTRYSCPLQTSAEDDTGRHHQHQNGQLSCRVTGFALLRLSISLCHLNCSTSLSGQAEQYGPACMTLWNAKACQPPPAWTTCNKRTEAERLACPWTQELTSTHCMHGGSGPAC